jgi:hypothetical protein
MMFDLAAVATHPVLRHIVVVTDPEELRRHGWKDPLPSYVAAMPGLWASWRAQHERPQS